MNVDDQSLLFNKEYTQLEKKGATFEMLEIQDAQSNIFDPKALLVGRRNVIKAIFGHTLSKD